MRILTILVAVGCIAAIIYGSVHWQQKIKNVPSEGVIASTNLESDKERNVGETVASSKGNIEDYVTSLPLDIAEFLVKASENQEKVELVIIGSGASTIGERVWPAIFKEEIESTYGELINVSVYDIPNATSIDVINGNLHMEAIDVTPDIIIFEPFILEDNGVVLLEQRLQHIKTMIADIKELNENAFFFLQPPHPVQGAVYYPLEVEELKVLAEEEGHTFIDHWTNWPDYQTDEIVEYLLPQNKAPSEKGHEVWAEYIVNIFINKEVE
ncbi:SGNH/GDSL hydrolase family protein [Sutcliffiella halmapala]|uniref:SGNH/GDSL hydrolase family protein n=1 Tax=Sutcliffiella halmapala TaxID=79882 RepID=UPI000995A084|nr:SGNH/GDSL hydrolase family protein [Sutcliffiella halmapala]